MFTKKADNSVHFYTTLDQSEQDFNLHHSINIHEEILVMSPT